MIGLRILAILLVQDRIPRIAAVMNIDTMVIEVVDITLTTMKVEISVDTAAVMDLHQDMVVDTVVQIVTIEEGKSIVTITNDRDIPGRTFKEEGIQIEGVNIYILHENLIIMIAKGVELRSLRIHIIGMAIMIYQFIHLHLRQEDLQFIHLNPFHEGTAYTTGVDEVTIQAMVQAGDHAVIRRESMETLFQRVQQDVIHKRLRSQLPDSQA